MVYKDFMNVKNWPANKPKTSEPVKAEAVEPEVPEVPEVIIETPEPVKVAPVAKRRTRKKVAGQE